MRAVWHLFMSRSSPSRSKWPLTAPTWRGLPSWSQREGHWPHKNSSSLLPSNFLRQAMLKQVWNATANTYVNVFKSILPEVMTKAYQDTIVYLHLVSTFSKVPFSRRSISKEFALVRHLSMEAPFPSSSEFWDLFFFQGHRICSGIAMQLFEAIFASWLVIYSCYDLWDVRIFLFLGKCKIIEWYIITDGFAFGFEEVKNHATFLLIVTL